MELYSPAIYSINPSGSPVHLLNCKAYFLVKHSKMQLTYKFSFYFRLREISRKPKSFTAIQFKWK